MADEGREPCVIKERDTSPSEGKTHSSRRVCVLESVRDWPLFKRDQATRRERLTRGILQHPGGLLLGAVDIGERLMGGLFLNMCQEISEKGPRLAQHPRTGVPSRFGTSELFLGDWFLRLSWSVFEVVSQREDQNSSVSLIRVQLRRLRPRPLEVISAAAAGRLKG